MKRTILLGAGCLALLGCGEETFETPPDCSGRRLLIYARQSAPDTADIYLYDFDAGGFHLLAGLNSASQADLDPAITFNVRFVAFERVLAGGDVDILLYDRCTATGIPQPGLNTLFAETDPAFSRNGLRLAFTRDTLGGRIRLYDGTLFQLVPLPGMDTLGTYQDHSPSLDHAATRIAFVSTRRGDHDVFVYDSSGDSLIDLPDLTGPGGDLDPWITPDGHYLAFASDRAGGTGAYDLYLYDLQTRSFVTLDAALNTAEDELAPALDPDANQIVFETNRTGTQGSTDLWIHVRNPAVTTRVGASGPGTDLQPYLVWQ